MPRAKLFFSEAFRSIGANLSTTVAATMTVLIGMFLLGLFIALFSWVNSWTDHVRKDVLVKVYFEQQPEATQAQINSVGAKIRPPGDQDGGLRLQGRGDRPDEGEVPGADQEPHRQPAPQRVRGDAEGRRPGLGAGVPSSPLPAGVEKVDYAQKKTERILSVTNVIKYIFLLGSVILLIASTILIANTIRLSIFSRRREVEVMKLVGASNWFVRGPFMLEGVICGLIGALAAIVLLVLAKELALPVIEGHSSTFSEEDVHALSFPLTALILVGVALAVGAAGSGITLRRFLRV